MKDITDKLKDAEETLRELERKKRKIEEKILTEKKKIEDYKNLIQIRQYAEIDSQLDSLGVTKEELLLALKNNNIQALLSQDK